MAGDWIKVESGTPHKPEVLKMARMLGISRREAFGLIVEFWIWLDGNSVDGVVDGVVDADVDALMSCVGLSAMLKAVKWASFETDPPRMVITNFGRHNGESAKKRALKSERQSKWRANVDATVDAPVDTRVDAPVDATASTREEKRRDIHTHARKRSTEVPLPADFGISERVRRWAEGKGYGPLEPYLEIFIGRHRANGKRYVDWDATFENAVREDWYGLRKSQKAAQEPRRVAL